jgi:hypothetical protein
MFEFCPVETVPAASHLSLCIKRKLRHIVEGNEKYGFENYARNPDGDPSAS